VCALPHLCMYRDSFTRVPWLIYARAIWLRRTHRDSKSLSASVHTRAMTHSCMCYDSFTCVPWLMMMIALIPCKGSLIPVTESLSDPDFKQKTETELTFWYVLPYFVHSEPFQSKQKQKQVCTSHIWICDHCDICDQNVTRSVLLKRLKKTRACGRGHRFKIVTLSDHHKCHTLSVAGTKPVSVSLWNLDWNGSDAGRRTVLNAPWFSKDFQNAMSCQNTKVSFTCTVKRNHKSCTSIFSQPIFLSKREILVD